MRELIKTTRTLTDKPFGVGVVLAFPFEENLNVILEEKVAVLQVYWGDCTRVEDGDVFFFYEIIVFIVKCVLGILEFRS